MAPLTVAQAAGEVLGSTPARLTGEMCARIALAELKKPLRFCNRYVSVSAGQAEDGTTRTRSCPASPPTSAARSRRSTPTPARRRT